MSTNLSASIEKLRTASSHLNQLSDEINATVKSIEETLRDEFKIGTPANIQIALGEDHTVHLEYRKVGAQFRIAVVLVSDDDRKTIKPWSDCTRDIKIETIKHLPKLIEELTSVVHTQLQDAEAASDAASGILASITEGE